MTTPHRPAAFDPRPAGARIIPRLEPVMTEPTAGTARSGVCAYARIDEAKVSATGQGSAWLAETATWFHRARMLTVVDPCVVGGTVYLHAHNVERAQELVDLAIRNGVPANCAKAVTRIDKPKAT